MPVRVVVSVGGRRRLSCTLSLALAFGLVSIDVAAAEATLQQTELQRLSGYVADVNERLVQLQQLLIESEQRGYRQQRLIESLEQRLRERQMQADGQFRVVREAWFKGVASRLAVLPVVRAYEDRLTVDVQPVYVHGTGELGAEGQQLLAPLAAVLRESLAELPPDLGWRLRIEGHADARPVRGNARFAGNWSLSAKRAVEMLRFLASQGVDEQRMYAAAMAATRPRVPGDAPGANRVNRRIEIHLELEASRQSPSPLG